MISVEVCYALSDRQHISALTVNSNCTVIRAIMLSGILDLFPEITLSDDLVGIYSKKVKLDHIVEEGDRIEIYRPLLLNPNQQRLRRAKNKT